MRAHFDGRLRVELRADCAGSLVLVRRAEEPLRETRLSMEPAAARDTADEFVREAFPHACADEDCGDWVEVTPPK